MNFKLTAICAAAVLCAASAVSCGKDKDSSSSDVILDINTTTSTEATSESEEATTVTTTGKKDDKKTTTTTAKKEETVTTKAADTEPETAAPEPEPGDNNEPEDPDVSTPDPDPVKTPTEAPKPKQEVFTTNDLNKPMSDFTAMFGNISPLDDTGACLAKGDGVNYQYPYSDSGIIFDCYSSSGTHYVYNITITGGNFSTDKGIRVGSTRADVISAYGESSSIDPFYVSDNGCVTFTINNDVVEKIQIGE